MIRIAHLVIALDNGGLENLVCRWAESRNEKSPNSTHIICLDHKGELAEQLSKTKVISLGAKRSRFPYDKESIRQIYEYCSKERIQLIHSHNLVAHQYGALGARAAHLPHIQTLHGFNMHCRSIKERIRARIMGYLTPMHTTVSEKVGDFMQDFYSVPPSRLRTIPNGVETHFPSEQKTIDIIKTELGIPEGALILGSVGRLAHVKGWDIFLPIFTDLIESQKKKHSSQSIHLVLVGDGPDRTEIEALVNKLRIYDHVHFAGFKSECGPYYDLFDVFVMPSRSEGLSVALLEAMAASRPVFATAVGEHTDLLNESRAGILLYPEDPDSWLNSMVEVVNDQKMLKEMGTNASNYVSSHYTQAKTLSAYEALYLELCA